MEDNKMSLGKKIKDLRNELGLSQEKLGKQTGIHPTHIGKYEANKTIPSADKLKKISEALGVTTDYLLFDNVSKAGRIEINDPELLEKFSLIDGLNEKNREALKCVIDAIILKGKIEGLTGQKMEIAK